MEHTYIYICRWQSGEGIIITVRLDSMVIKIVVCIEFNKFSKTGNKLQSLWPNLINNLTPCTRA